MSNINKVPFMLLKVQKWGYSEVKFYICLFTYSVKTNDIVLYANEDLTEIDPIKFYSLVKSMKLTQVDFKENAIYNSIEVYSYET